MKSWFLKAKEPAPVNWVVCPPGSYRKSFEFLCDDCDYEKESLFREDGEARVFYNRSQNRHLTKEFGIRYPKFNGSDSADSLSEAVSIADKFLRGYGL